MLPGLAVENVADRGWVDFWVAICDVLPSYGQAHYADVPDIAAPQFRAMASLSMAHPSFDGGVFEILARSAKEKVPWEHTGPIVTAVTDELVRRGGASMRDNPGIAVSTQLTAREWLEVAVAVWGAPAHPEPAGRSFPYFGPEALLN